MKCVVDIVGADSIRPHDFAQFSKLAVGAAGDRSAAAQLPSRAKAGKMITFVLQLPGTH
jgi:hypothetical protein